jgi:hypothetical protein
MGQDTAGREADYIETAMHVFHLETQLGAPDDDALKHAFEAAIARAQQGFIIGVRDDILDKAETLDADEESDLIEDGVASLIWYAIVLDDQLPPELRRENYT